MVVLQNTAESTAENNAAADSKRTTEIAEDGFDDTADTAEDTGDNDAGDTAQNTADALGAQVAGMVADAADADAALAAVPDVTGVNSFGPRGDGVLLQNTAGNTATPPTPASDARAADNFEHERGESRAQFEQAQRSFAKAEDALRAARSELRRVQDENDADSQDPDSEQTRLEKQLRAKEDVCKRDHAAARFDKNARGIAGRKRRLVPDSGDAGNAGRANYAEECRERQHWRDFQQRINEAVRQMYSLATVPDTAGALAPLSPRPYPVNEDNFQADLETAVLPWLRDTAPSAVKVRAKAVNRERTPKFDAVAPKGPGSAGRADFRADFNAETAVDYPHQDPAHPEDAKYKVAFELKCGKLESGRRHELTGQVDGYLKRGYDMVIVVVFCTNPAVTPATLGFSGNPRVAVSFVHGLDAGQESDDHTDDDGAESDVVGDEDEDEVDDAIASQSGWVKVVSGHTARGEGELALDVGEYVELIKKTSTPWVNDDTWLRGRANGGSAGHFPKGCVCVDPDRPYTPDTARGLEEPEPHSVASKQADSARRKMPFYANFRRSPEWRKAYFDKERFTDRMFRAFSEHSKDVDVLRSAYEQINRCRPPEWCALIAGNGLAEAGAATLSRRQQAFRRCTAVEDMTEIICGGSTQVGKTMFKTVGILVARQCGRKIPSIVITTGVNGARDLALKIARQIQALNDSPATPVDVMTVNQEVCLSTHGSEDPTLGLGDKRAGMPARGARRAMLRRGGVIVLAHSMAQIGDVFFDLLHLQEEDLTYHGTAPIQPAVFVDEADEMQRSPIDGSDDGKPTVKFEYALLKLLGVEPHSHRRGNVCGTQCAGCRRQPAGPCTYRVDNGAVTAKVAKDYIREECQRKSTRYPYFPPCVVVDISATLVPVFAKIAAREEAARQGPEDGGFSSDDVFISLAPPGAYIGLKDFKTLTRVCGERCASCRRSSGGGGGGDVCKLCAEHRCDRCRDSEDGEDSEDAAGCGVKYNVYLKKGDLTHRNSYFDDKVADLFRDASKDPKSLTLNITTSRVNASGFNIHS